MIYRPLYSKEKAHCQDRYYRTKDVRIYKDLTSKPLLDFAYMGMGTNPLGYNDKDVNEAVINCINDGNMSTLDCMEMDELGQLLLDLHPGYNDVRFAKTGGEAMKIAFEIAYESMLISENCMLEIRTGYHGWHLSDGRVNASFTPSETISYLEKNKHNVVLFEPVRYEIPTKEYVEKFNELTKDCIVIADEITSGWRFANGSAALKYGFKPDIIVYAKGMSNGYPMAAIIGKDLSTDKFISSTYWGDRIGFVAAIATIKKMIKNNVSDYIKEIGHEYNKIWIDAGYKYSIKGTDYIPHIEIDYFEAMSKYFLKNDILCYESFYPSLSHGFEHLKRFKEVLQKCKIIHN